MDKLNAIEQYCKQCQKKLAKAARRCGCAPATYKNSTKLGTGMDYTRWLRRYLASGGEIQNFYSYETSVRKWLIATKPFKVGAECGTAARNIIVPSGMEIEGLNGDTGHNNLYFMNFDSDGGLPIRVSIAVPAFSDTLAMLEEIERKERNRELRREHAR